MYDDKIYYEDQSSWTPADFYALWRFLDRLFGYAGPTPGMIANPNSRSALIQAKKTGLRDEELAALDLGRMSEDTRYLMKHLLVHTGRFDLVLERFPNLAGLREVADEGHVVRLAEQPKGVYEYYTRVGILL